MNKTPCTLTAVFYLWKYKEQYIYADILLVILICQMYSILFKYGIVG